MATYQTNAYAHDTRIHVIGGHGGHELKHSVLDTEPDWSWGSGPDLPYAIRVVAVIVL